MIPTPLVAPGAPQKMPLSDDIRRDFLSIWAEVPVHLFFEGHKLRALVSQGTHSADLEPGGFLPQLGATARVLRDECPPGLKVGAQVTLDGEPYRVEGISYRAGLPISTLDLKHL